MLFLFDSVTIDKKKGFSMLTVYSLHLFLKPFIKINVIFLNLSPLFRYLIFNFFLTFFWYFLIKLMTLLKFKVAIAVSHWFQYAILHLTKIQSFWLRYVRLLSMTWLFIFCVVVVWSRKWNWGVAGKSSCQQYSSFTMSMCNWLSFYSICSDRSSVS